MRLEYNTSDKVVHRFRRGRGVGDADCFTAASHFTAGSRD
jgi:hypothetical protein